MIDSHCHPNSKELEDKAAEIIERAFNSGVEKMIIVGCAMQDSVKALNMAENFARFGTYASVGIHPHEAQKYIKNINLVLDEFEEIIINDKNKNKKIVAWGEIGLDYYYDISPRDAQKKIFISQLERAEKLNIPVILHIRDAMDDALDILNDFCVNLKLLFHCYSGGLKYLEKVLETGGLCAVGGALTWKKSEELRKVIEIMPLNKLLLETDCPYMTPAPFRGKLNEPAYIKYVYEAAAKIKNIELKEFEESIKINFENFFNF